VPVRVLHRPGSALPHAFTSKDEPSCRLLSIAQVESKARVSRSTTAPVSRSRSDDPRRRPIALVRAPACPTLIVFVAGRSCC